MARGAFWTILVDDQPTAFRAPAREDLLPTLTQLQRQHPNALIKWFQKGRLWESPGEAMDAAKPPRQKAGWRPGGDHADPRDKYKLPRDVKRKRWSEQARDGRGPFMKTPPRADVGNSPPRRDDHGAGGSRPDRPAGRPRSEARPDRDARPRGDTRPSDRRDPGGSSQPAWSARPPAAADRRPRNDGGDPRDGREGGGWTPRAPAADRPRNEGRQTGDSRPERAPATRPRGDARADRDARPRTEWRPDRDARSRAEWRPDRDGRPRSDAPGGDRRDSEKASTPSGWARPGGGADRGLRPGKGDSPAARGGWTPRPPGGDRPRGDDRRTRDPRPDRDARRRSDARPDRDAGARGDARFNRDARSPNDARPPDRRGPAPGTKGAWSTRPPRPSSAPPRSEGPKPSAPKGRTYRAGELPPADRKRRRDE